MRYIRWVGLLPSLLIVGVLGGLTAPLPSDAAAPAPTLLLWLDPVLDSAGAPTGSGTNIRDQRARGTAPNICTTDTVVNGVVTVKGESSLGFNACFNVLDGVIVGPGTNGRYYKLLAITPGANADAVSSARLLITDKASKDGFRLKGFKLVPSDSAGNISPGGHPVTYGSASADRTEAHSMKIVMRNVNNFIANPSNATYSLSLYTAGYFVGGPDSAVYDSVGDYARYEGSGIFGANNTSTVISGVNAANTDFMSFQVGAPAGLPTSFTFNQIAQYPATACDADGLAGTTNDCTPTITLTTSATVYGPDTLFITGTQDLSARSCLTRRDFDLDWDKEYDDDIHLPSCRHVNKQFTNRIENVLKPADQAIFIANNVSAGVRCVDNCPCADPAVCRGTIVTLVKPFKSAEKTVLANKVLPFKGEGTGIDPDFTILTNPATSSAPGEGSKTFGATLTGSGPWKISANFPTSPNTTKPWEVEDITCVSTLNSEGTAYTLGPPTDSFETTLHGSPVTVTGLGAGDTLTCTWSLEEDDEFFIHPVNP